MATTVELDEETESKLEELQAEIELQTGTEVTRQEILARLVQSAAESRSEFVDSFRDAKEVLSEEEIAAFNAGTISSGVETDDDDVDDVLYG